SPRRQDSLQRIAKHAVLHLECLRAVVLVVACRHGDDEIELRYDAYRLPASTERADPADCSSVRHGLAAPPEIAVVLVVCRLNERRSGSVDPALRYDLAPIP